VARRDVTSRDIAREAGVSQPTVSRALRGDPRVAPATVAQVEAAARRLGYVANAAGRSLRTRRTGTVAIVIADITNPFYPELVEALHHELARSGRRSVLLNERTDIVGAEDIGELLRSGLADGAIVATATDDDRTRALLRDQRAPIVQVVREVDGAPRDAVVCDNEGGGALAAELLAGLGHRRIGVIGGPANTSTALAREAGFGAALARRGLRLDPELVRRGEFAHRTGHAACLELLALSDPPTALFCGNDVIAFGALDAARRARIPVPERLSVVGFDDVSLAGWEAFRLTTVRQPLAEMAREAARTLVWRLEDAGEAPPQRTVFPVDLVARDTAGPPQRG
jgi:LacI family transcriptional regulator